MEFTVKMSEKELKKYLDYLELNKNEYKIIYNKKMGLDLDEITKQLTHKIEKDFKMGC